MSSRSKKIHVLIRDRDWLSGFWTYYDSQFSWGRPFANELQNIWGKIRHILKLKKGASDHEITCIVNLKWHEESSLKNQIKFNQPFSPMSALQSSFNCEEMDCLISNLQTTMVNKAS